MLSQAQLDRLNEAILALYKPFPMDELPDRFLAAVRIALPAELVHISVTSPAEGVVDAFLDRPAHAALARLAAHRDDLMAMPGFSDGGFYLGADRGPVSYLDFMDRRRLEATALWEYFCKPLDLQSDLSVNFHRTEGQFFTISSSRSGRPHDASERAILSFLQPHLRQRFQLATSAEPCHPLLAANCDAPSAGPLHIICDKDGKMLYATPASVGTLERIGIQLGATIPDDWAAWIRVRHREEQINRAGPLRFCGNQGQSGWVHHLSDPEAAEHHLLIGFEHVKVAIGFQGLLTPREEEVAARLVEGKTNREIARILGISTATAKHHVANILAKLMVENRTAAANCLRSRRPAKTWT